MEELKELKEILLDLRGRKIYHSVNKDDGINKVNADIDRALMLLDEYMANEEGSPDIDYEVIKCNKTPEEEKEILYGKRSQ